MAADAELIEAAERGDGAFLAANLEDYQPGIGPDPRLESVKDAEGKTLLEIAGAKIDGRRGDPKCVDAILELILNKGAWLPPDSFAYDRQESRYNSTINLLVEASCDFKYPANTTVFAAAGVFLDPIDKIDRGKESGLISMREMGEMSKPFLRRAAKGELRRFGERIIEEDLQGHASLLIEARDRIADPHWRFYGAKELCRHHDWLPAAFAAIPQLGEKLAEGARLYRAEPRKAR